MDQFFRGFIKNFFLVISYCAFSYGSFYSQTLSINEFSNGPSGTKEYIEFIVIDTGATYDCVNLTIPCVDIRGWIIDDNNGYHGSNGVAGGCNRFSNDVFWSCIPVGTIITIYNGTDANPALPPDDISMTDGNCRLVIPIENTTLFDNNTSTPGAIACDYPLTGWNPGGVWFRIGMRNGGDCVRIVDLAGCEVFSLSYGDVNLNSTIYFPGSGTDDVFFFNGGDPSIQTNWSQGCAGDIASCGSDDQTPGLSNSSLNEDYISQFNHNCEPLTILSTVASNIANASCICDGNATIEASGSIPTYSYEWTDINFISIGQNSATASNLCQGVYHCIVESSIGCLDTIQVTIDQNSSLITPSFTPIEEICSGELFILPSNSNNGITGTWSPIINNTSTTNYTFTPDAGQCAIDTTLTVIVNQNSIGTDTQNACDSYTWIDGVTYTSSNSSATILLTAIGGCDSLVTLDLTIGNSNTGIDTQTSCDTYTWIDGNTYTTSNNSATWILTNAAGCDSTVTLDLTITNSNSGTDSQTSCDTYTWIDGNTYTTSNNSATWILTNAAGCDSTVTLDLTITNSNSGTDTQGACDTYTWIDGNTYTVSNNSATWILTNAAGCDSTVTLDLTITNSNTGTDTQSACDTYTWIDGNTYTATNNSATVMLSTIDGCDSLVTLDLTINNSYSTTDVQGACDSYTWIDGNTYTTSNNTASFMLSSMTGCDSLVTLDLTIDNSLVGTDAQSACDSYTWIDGVTYTSSNNTATILLTASGGCDSLVTLDLTIGNSNTGIDTQNACDTYTWIDGNTYTVSNNSATWILTNAAGCDSTVTLDLTITNSNSGTDTQTACDTYTWIDGNTYTTSNNSATWILTNTAGCDSTVTLDLTINNTPSFTISGTDPSVCNASDGSITISGLNANTSYTLGYDSLNIASQVSLMTTDVTGKFVINGLLAGVYTNFSISLNGCEHTSVDVIDLNNPGAPIIDNQSSLTECDTYTLADITGSNLSGNESYYTEANGGGTPLNAGDVISATQTIYIYDILGTCADESSFTITVDYTPSLTDPGPQDSCESYFLPLSISGTNLSGNENYYSDLQNNGGTVIVDAITSSQTVYIYDANGACSNEISFEITINELPTLVSFTGEGTYCEGEAINNLFAEVSGTPDYTLEYTLNGNPLSITSSSSNIDLGNTEGVYVLTSLTDNSCDISLSETQTININTTPDAPIVGQDESYCSNVVPEDIQASGSTGGYSWYIDASLSELIGSTQSYTPDVIMGSTSYYVTVTENGCEGLPTEVSITIEDCQIIIPTAFTPNDDQINDTWELGNIDDIYPNNVVSVYNRWGNKVYESDKGAYNQRPWNGTFNQETLPVASYYFIIEFNNNSSQNKTGIVSIVK